MPIFRLLITSRRRLIGLLYLLFIVPLHTSAQSPDAAQEVSSAQTGAVQHLTARGVSHYQIKLVAGDFLHLQVAQLENEIAVQWYDLANRPVFRTDRPELIEGVEDVLFVAEQEGLYRFDVQSADDASRHQVRVLEVRPANAADRERVAARRTLERTLELFSRLARGDANVRDELRPSFGASLQNFARLKADAATPRSDLAEYAYSLGYLWFQRRDAAKAQEFLAQALAVQEALPQATPLETARICQLLGQAYDLQNAATDAKISYERALTLTQQQLGVRHRDTLVAENSLARFEANTLLNYQAAISRQEKVIQIANEILGPQHSDTAAYRKNLAQFYLLQGRYAEALNIAQQALAMEPDKRKKLPKLLILGQIYYALGNYQEAVRRLREGLDAGADFAEPAELVTFYNELGGVYEKLGDYAQAASFYDKAVAAITQPSEKIIARANRSNIRRLQAQSNPRTTTDEWQTIATDYQTLIDSLPPDNPMLADALGNRAKVFFAQGQYAAFNELLTQALAIYRRTLDANHNYLASALFLQGLTALHRSRPDAAQTAWQENLAIREQNLRRYLVIGSAQDKRAFLNSLRPETDTLIAADALTNTPGSRNLALEVILQRKVRDVDVLTAQLARLWDSDNPIDRQLIAQLQDAYRRLSNPSQSQKAQEVINDLERRLSAQDAGYQESARRLSVNDLQARLKPDEVYLDIVAYRPNNFATPFAAPLPERYRVYVARANEPVQALDLGERAAIDRQVRQWRNEMNQRQSGADPQSKLARRLYRRLVAPLSPMLKGARSLILVPDGDLQLLNFGALVDEQGRYLLERYALRTLNSGRELVRESGAAPQQQSVVFAPVNFRYAKVSPLPNTRREARTFQQMFPDAQVLWEDNATEANLKQMKAAPAILYLPTHAIFDPENTVPMPSSQTMEQTRRLVVDEAPAANAMLRSFFILADYGQKNRREDGQVTAQELASLNLRGSLVIFAACETGLGDASEAGAGVAGLRRAAFLAGARAQISTLWEISDRGTPQLLQGFLTALKRGRQPAAALRQSQLALIKNQVAPYYWAGFVALGQ